jgi:acid phosphatase
MPYLNSLAATYGLATQYYGNTHPSNGNYFMLATGEISPAKKGSTVTADNVVRHLLSAGKTWTAYEESLPYAGCVKPDAGLYVRHHCPLSYLSDVIDSKNQILNLVPFTQFATDLANGHLPDYSFITPNVCDDAHSCSLATADAWLQTNIDPLIKSSTFQDGGLLIITFDESFRSDKAHGGGQVAWIAISPQFSNLAYKSTTLYQHQNTLDDGGTRVNHLSRPGAVGCQHGGVLQVEQPEARSAKWSVRRGSRGNTPAQMLATL